MVEAFNVEAKNILMKDGSSSHVHHKHRIILDSGCSENITCRLDWLRNLRTLTTPITVRGAFGKTCKPTQYGDMYLTIKGNNFVVKDVIYCDALQDTLLSYVKLTNRGHHIDTSQMKLISKSGNCIISLSMKGDILTFTDEPTPINNTTKLKQPESSPSS
jgi:hypothetical protein